MKLGFSYKFLCFLLLIVILAYIYLEYFNVIEGKRGRSQEHCQYDRQMRRRDRREDRRREATGRPDIRDTLGSAIWRLSNVYDLNYYKNNQRKRDESDSA